VGLLLPQACMPKTAKAASAKGNITRCGNSLVSQNNAAMNTA
jgi:hypothetical protein